MGKHAYESHQIKLVTASLVVILNTGEQMMVNKVIAPKEKIPVLTVSNDTFYDRARVGGLTEWLSVEEESFF